jgi:hypothetical protein
VTELTCVQVREEAAEFALDILEPEARSLLAAHLLRCQACREEVDAMCGVATRLIELVPGTEPPLGFDRRVLARVRDIPPASRSVWPFRHHVGLGGGRRSSRRNRLIAAATAIAAAAALIFGSVGWLMGRSDHPTPDKLILAAEFEQGGHDLGEVYAYRGTPPWLNMTVHDVRGDQKVTCELLGKDGSRTLLGSFDLVNGSGSWGAPDRWGLTGISGARLVGSHGQVIATAIFRS